MKYADITYKKSRLGDLEKPPEKKLFRTIVINLGDNDYGSTFEPLLESIYQVILWRESESYDKEFIERIIREGIAYHYLAFQRHSKSDKNLEHTLKHLSGIRILFDDEAEQFIQTHDQDGGAWYLEVQTGKVYSF